MNKFSQLLTLSSLTLTGLCLASTPVLAFEFSVENQTGNDYTYTVTLDADDSLAFGDQLILTNLSGVTAASANSPYTLGGSDATSANFSVATATSGVDTLTGVFSLTSPDSFLVWSIKLSFLIMVLLVWLAVLLMPLPFPSVSLPI